MKLLGRLFALLLTIASAVLLTAVYLLLSPQGLEWSYRFATILLPGQLTVEQLEGRLRGPIKLSGVHYHDDKIDLRMAHLDLQWRPGELVEARLHIESLAVRGLHITEAPAKSGAGGGALPDIRLPLALQIDRAELHDFHLTAGDTGGVVINDAILHNATFRRGRLDLKQLAVTAPRFHISVSGNLSPQRDYPVDLTVQWSADGGEYGQLAGSGRLRGDLRKLDVHQRLTAPVKAELNGAVIDPLGKLAWQGELRWPAINLHALRAAWPAVTVSGKIHGSGDLKHVEAEGELHSRYRDLHADHRFLINYRPDTIQVRRFTSTVSETGTTVAVHGSLSRLTQTPQADLAGNWRNLRWPPQGPATVRSQRGSFSISGTLDDYRLQLAGDVAGAQIPGATWSLDAAGGPQTLTVTRAAAHVLGGDITASGQVDWRAAPKWRMSIQGEGLNPGKQWPQWPGQLALKADVDGAMKDGEPRIRVALTRLHGQLKSAPLDADAALDVRGARLRLEHLRIASGDNRLTAAGTLGDEWNLAWQVNAANLAQLLPDDGGHLQGSGNLSGPRLRPVISASLSGEQLHFAATRVRSLSAVMAVDTRGRIPSILELEASDADFGGQHIDAIRLHGNGTDRRHHVELSVTMPIAKLALALSGEYLPAAGWQGRLERLDLDTSVAGDWHLAAATPLSFADGKAQMQEFCLQQDRARWCAAAHVSAADDWQLRTRARDLPMSLLEKWLPTGSSLTGKLDAGGRLGATPTMPVSGEVEMTLQAGTVAPATLGAEKPTTRIAYRGGHFQASLDGQALNAKLHIDLADGGGVAGEMRIEREALPAPLGGGQTKREAALTGRLQGDIRDLSLLPAFIPGIEHTRGQLSSTLNIAGSWDSPRLSGELHLENGALSIPSLGLTPDNVDIVMRGDQTGRLRIDAQLRSKDGSLRLGGQVSYRRPQGWDIQARLEGDRAEIVNTPEFHVLASPKMRLSVTGRRIAVDGELFIPEANLRPRDVSGAVSPSDDVVIVNEPGAAPPEQRWQIFSNLRVRLGDFVKFNGFGLRGLLKGDFTLKDQPDKPTMARGELSIVDGDYRAYGQKLAVERGRLLFFGGPVDNPGLDVRAVRKIQSQNVTAGIMVRGTLKAPQVQLFSEPAMAETDILSYLLTGQPMNQASSAQGQQLYGAALSLGLAGSGLLASQIGRRFGIDQLTVESGGSFGSGALVIRHYLSPKLYISYGVGLIEHLNVFLMRYQISRIWALEAESGSSQSGADLVYTLEKK
ncbi:MAG: translocation/assembly module TamB domain-containing protein [Gammaproteobacteria bacterium]